MGSKEHRVNLLDPRYVRIGVGIAMGTPLHREQPSATYVAEFDSGPDPGALDGTPPGPAVDTVVASAPSSLPPPVTPARTAALRARQTVRAWFEAARLGDGRTFCRLEDNRFLKSQYRLTGSAGRAACVAAFTAVSALPAASELRLARVRTSGTRATMTVAAQGQRVAMVLRKWNGHWKLDAVASLTHPVSGQNIVQARHQRRWGNPVVEASVAPRHRGLRSRRRRSSRCGGVPCRRPAGPTQRVRMRLPKIAIASALLAVAGPPGSAHAAGCEGADVAPTPATLGADGRGHRCRPNQERAAAGDAGRARRGDHRRDRLRPRDGQGGVLRARRAVGTKPADRLTAIRYRPRGRGRTSRGGVGRSTRRRRWQGADGVRGASDQQLHPDFRRVGIPGRTWRAGCRRAGGGDLSPLRHRAGGQQLFPGADCRPSPGAPRSAAGAPSSISLRRRAAAQVKRAVRTWMDAGRSGDATAFCRLRGQPDAAGPDGQDQRRGHRGLPAGFRPNPSLPPASESVIRRVTIDGTKATLKLIVTQARATMPRWQA